LSKYDPRAIKHDPKGDDSCPLPERFAHLADHGITAHVYGHTIFLKGGAFSTAIIDEILRKINNQESVVVIVSGEPGSGKTYFAMRLAQILDQKFHCTDIPELPPKEDHGQIAFSREHLTHLVSSDSPLKRTQVICIDESHFGLGSRDFQNREQKDLINLLSAIRSRGYVLIVVVLHSSMIDKVLRDYIFNLECHMTKRGTATVYRRWFPQFGDKVHSKKLGTLQLQLPDEGLCNYPTCLDCPWLNKSPDERCETIRAIYERRKSLFLDKVSEGKTIAPNGKAKPEMAGIAEELEPFATEIKRNKKGGIINYKLPPLVKEKLGYSINVNHASVLSDEIEKQKWWKSLLKAL